MEQVISTTDDGQQTTEKQPAVLRFLAHLLSYIFHPLFIPLYAAYFLVYIHPSYFAGYGNSYLSDFSRSRVMIQVVLNAVMYPLVAVLLCKGLGFIESIYMRTQKDRVLGYITSMIFFFWTYYAFQQEGVPKILVSFMFGVFISSAAALIANIYYKVSMHAIGMGGLVGLFLVIMQDNTMLMTGPLFFALLIAGAVCTARLIVSDHTQKEIYAGLLIGLLCQVMGAVVNLS